LRQSLGSLGQEDFRSIGEKVTDAPSRTGSNLTALKKFDRETAGLEIEIQLPTMEEALAKREAAKEAAKRPKYDPKEYQAMLRERIEGVEACYTANVPSGDAGRVTVSFAISSGGSVRRSALEDSTFRNPGLERCILERISKLTFDPPPWDGFAVTYGFRFGARQIRF
jgi:TonB family protein